ncbi:MAG: hypothetical protein KJS98_20995, partial [Nitrospirae bacterium]|nr:hypothetical protein [Nitrospirota bacterium]
RVLLDARFQRPAYRLILLDAYDRSSDRASNVMGMRGGYFYETESTMSGLQIRTVRLAHSYDASSQRKVQS